MDIPEIRNRLLHPKLSDIASTLLKDRYLNQNIAQGFLNRKFANKILQERSERSNTDYKLNALRM